MMKKRIFNYRLSRARRYIECTFGILANKWRIFHRPINVNTDFAEDIIKACCILHNFVIERDGYNFEHTLTDELNSLQQQENVQGGVVTNTIRDHFSTHFESDIGAVPWQDSKI
uniref:DDE Tnp4 domain-containing protein n=1 Tax=Schizaphis graminum TaxID=13262 RepID=A0A2S2PQM4_SCHGA